MTCPPEHEDGGGHAIEEEADHETDTTAAAPGARRTFANASAETCDACARRKPGRRRIWRTRPACIASKSATSSASPTTRPSPSSTNSSKPSACRSGNCSTDGARQAAAVAFILQDCIGLPRPPERQWLEATHGNEGAKWAGRGDPSTVDHGRTAQSRIPAL